MFFIKKPFNLQFTKDNPSQVKKLTVCTREGVSNTKLIVYEDGSIYLKNGSQYFKMSFNEIKKPTEVCRAVDGGYRILEKLEKKGFLHKE